MHNVLGSSAQKNNEHVDRSLWNEARNKFDTRVDLFGELFHVENETNPDITSDSEPESSQEPVSNLQGLGYHSVPSDVVLNESTLVVPEEYDIGHEDTLDDPFRVSLDGDNQSDYRLLNDEILEPGRFLKRAIEQMRYFGSANLDFPIWWLDEWRFQGRYVHPDILEERFTDLENEFLEDNPYCKWSELERAHILTKHNREIGDNFDEFLVNKNDEASFSIIHHLEEQTRNCEHLPVIWSVYNARSIGSLPTTRKVFLDEAILSGDGYLDIMHQLIRSRYLVNLGYTYSKDSKQRIKGLLRDHFFSKEELEKPPFVILDDSRGDIFLLPTLDGDVFSLYDSSESLELGRKVGEAFGRYLAKRLRIKLPTTPQSIEVHGLVSTVIGKRLGEPDNLTRKTVGLEVLLHTLISFDMESLVEKKEIRDQFSSLLMQSLVRFINLPNNRDRYRERCFWAITRGELGHETDVMRDFNKKRNLGNVLRSSWDFAKRSYVSTEYVKNGSVPRDVVLDLLEDFHPDDAVTFSNNAIVYKGHVEQAIEQTLCNHGLSGNVIDARINSLNTSYSDNGGPRLYSQKELDYMMTNVRAWRQRRRLTTRLLSGGIVFCLFSYVVSEEAKKRNMNALSHVFLCKLYLEGPEVKNRQLVVEWLEGVFDNIYKLCAVPLLTYLSMYFGVRVKQREYSRLRTLEIENAFGPCGPTALYAANERMRRLVATRNRNDWEPYTLTFTEGRDYVFELVCSLLFYQSEDKSVQMRMDERMRAIPKIVRKLPN